MAGKNQPWNVGDPGRRGGLEIGQGIGDGQGIGVGQGIGDRQGTA